MGHPLFTKHRASKFLSSFAKRSFHMEHTMESFFHLSFSHPHNPFIEFYADNKLTKLSYQQVEHHIYGYSAFLKEQLVNIPLHSYIALDLPNSPQWIIAFYALLRCGYRPFLLNSTLDDNTKIILCHQLDIPALISDHPLDTLLLIAPDGLKYQKEEDGSSSFENFFALSTTGTQGLPKIVIYSGEEVFNALLAYSQYAAKERDAQSLYHYWHKEVAILPFYHIYGLFVIFFFFSTFGFTFVIPPSLAPSEVIETLKKRHVTCMVMVPAIWKLIGEKIIQEAQQQNKAEKFNKTIDYSLKIQNKYPRFGPFLARNVLFKGIRAKALGTSLTYGLSGGGFISTNTLRIMNGLGYRLANGYGMSEYGIGALEHQMKLSDMLKGNIGKPLLGVTFKIDPDSGELLMKNQAAAYEIIDNGKHTLLSKEEFYQTGDYAKEVDGLIYLQGRLDDMIISSNGENISPDYLESYFTSLKYPYVIVNCQGVSTLLFKVPQSFKISQQERLYYEFRKINQGLSPVYKIQAVRMTSNDFPLVSKMMISRKKLVEAMKNDLSAYPLLGERLSSLEKSASTDPKYQSLLKAVISLFSKVLHISEDKITADSDFFSQLGGDSLSYYELISQLNKFSSIDISKKMTTYLTTPGDITLLLLSLS